MSTKKRKTVATVGRKSAKNQPKTLGARASKATPNPSAKPSGRKMVPQPHGGALIPGAGGGPQPGSGRPKNEFKAWCAGLLDDATNRQQVEDVLRDKSHPAFATMWKAVADRAHGKPGQSVDVTSNGKGLTLEALVAGSMRIGFGD